MMKMSDADYELLDRIDRGEQIFRVNRTEEGLRVFADQIDRLLGLRARHWIRLPDTHISRGPDGESLAIGPCELTALGREELERDRRLGPRRGVGTSPARESTLVGRTLGAGVRIREKLGDTPVGALYRGEYPNGLEVAVVILGTASDNSAALTVLRQRFRNAIQIQHPNLSAIHEVSETHDGLVYVLAEPLAGELLSETPAKRGPLPLEESLDLWQQAAAGLQAAHDAHWIHGNLSPDSILLTQTTGGGPQVKLIGFSQAPLRQTGSGRLSDHRVSTEYASPERIAGQAPDERSDVFSLGAVLHYLLTGVPPSSASEGTRIPKIPKALRSVLHRALDPLPARRFQTVAEFAAAVAPPQEDAAAVTSEMVRGRRRGAFALGAAAVALIAVAAGLWLLWETQRPSAGGLARAKLQESASVAAIEPDSLSAFARLPTDTGPVALGRRDSAAAPVPADTGPSGAAADSLLVDVRSVDSTIQVDLRYATPNNFTGAPVPGYEAPRALLRPEVAAALGRVQARLRTSGLSLRILDAYRPVRASLAMVEWAERTGHRALLESGYIAPRSRHNLGVAVDLTLVELETGAEVPMGTAVDSFGALADTANATPGALRYREMLVRTMESEGFSTYGQAWWHFSYSLPGAMPLDRVIR